MKLSKAEKARRRDKRISGMHALLEANDYRVECYGRGRSRRYEVIVMDECECCGNEDERPVAQGRDEEYVCRKAIRENELSWGDFGPPGKEE